MTYALSHTCPNCGRVQEMTSAVTEAGKYKAEPLPARGDFSLCIRCGEWGVFDGLGGLRKPNAGESLTLRTSPLYQKIAGAWAETIVEVNKGKRLQ